MRAIAAITLTLATTLPAAAQPVMYSVLDLGANLVPTAINASGQTTGYAIVSGVQTAFRGSADGQITYLGGGLGVGNGVRGVGINVSGQIAATVYSAPAVPVLTTATGDLSTATVLLPNGGHGSALAVNDIGQVAGAAFLPGFSGSQNDHAMRTTPGGVFDASADLGTFGGTSSTAFAINAVGRVTGTAYFSGDTIRHAFRTSGNGTLSTADDFGTFGGPSSVGAAINASGQVAGYAQLPNSDNHTFRSSPQGQPVSIQDLGTLGGPNSYANGINALESYVVGFARDAQEFGCEC